MLITPFEIFRKRNILDPAKAQQRDNRLGNVVERATSTRTGIGDPAEFFRSVRRKRSHAREKHVQSGEVSHENKVAPLLTVTIRSGTLEEPYDACLINLFCKVVHDRRHASFV